MDKDPAVQIPFPLTNGNNDHDVSGTVLSALCILIYTGLTVTQLVGYHYLLHFTIEDLEAQRG